MKYLYRFIIFFAGLLAQWWCGTFFSSWGTAPHVLLVLTLGVASAVGPVTGQGFAFFWGLCLDALSPHLFGANTLTLTILAYIVGNSRRQMDVSNPVSQALLVFALSYAYLLLMLLVGVIFRGQSFWPGWPVFLVVPFLNGIFAPVGYAVVRHYIQV